MSFKNFLKALLISLSLPSFASYCLEEMTLEEKVGQLLMVHFNGKVANEEAKRLIQNSHVGGIIYYNWANGLDCPEKVYLLSAGLQKLADQNRHPIPLFIAIDQEGGLVARLTKGFTVFPGNRALGMTRDCDLSEKSAFFIGKELKNVGVNFNLAPVVDVNSNPRNPVIGIRSFSDSTEIVIPFAEQAIKGYQRAGVITSLKHFPGHGDVEIDSHQDLPLIKKSRDALETIEFLPFRKLCSKADTIMTAHVVIPSLDPIHCATLSKTLLDILREDMGFQGVIISDSLVMEGLLKNCDSIEDAAIKALNAGCDILMLGGKQLIGAHANLELTVADIETIHRAIVDAVKKGVISEKRVDEAVRRILALKIKYALCSKEYSFDPFIDRQEHHLLSQKIALLALVIKENRPLSFPLSKGKIALFAPEIVKESICESFLVKIGKETYLQFFKGLNPTEEEMEESGKIAEKADCLIFCSYNAWKNSHQMALIRSLSEGKKPLVLLSLGDPQDAILFPQAALTLTTFSPTPPSIQAAADKLCEINPRNDPED